MFPALQRTNAPGLFPARNSLPSVQLVLLFVALLAISGLNARVILPVSLIAIANLPVLPAERPGQNAV
jgi:hypothetical protein